MFQERHSIVTGYFFNLYDRSWAPQLPSVEIISMKWGGDAADSHGGQTATSSSFTIAPGALGTRLSRSSSRRVGGGNAAQADGGQMIRAQIVTTTTASALNTDHPQVGMTTTEERERPFQNNTTYSLKGEEIAVFGWREPGGSNWR